MPLESRPVVRRITASGRWRFVWSGKEKDLSATTRRSTDLERTFEWRGAASRWSAISGISRGKNAAEEKLGFLGPLRPDFDRRQPKRWGHEQTRSDARFWQVSAFCAGVSG